MSCSSAPSIQYRKDSRNAGGTLFLYRQMVARFFQKLYQIADQPASRSVSIILTFFLHIHHGVLDLSHKKTSALAPNQTDIALVIN